LIDALLGVVTGSSSRADGTTPVINDLGATEATEHRWRILPTISYAIRGQAALMNSWEDPHYFTGAFPMLFPIGLGGH
jgi:hypothetical protein